jgi:hypothetical protein
VMDTFMRWVNRLKIQETHEHGFRLVSIII